jgi:MOSC domain-containing protein YiiM
MQSLHARIESVNVGRPRTVPFRGKLIRTAIWKYPVNGSIRAEGVNVTGDDQADRRVHGGDDKAIYAYAAEDYVWWRQELGREMEPGTFGDNLTTAGLEITHAVVGERWRTGTALLQVAAPRIPCFKLGIKMGNKSFPRRFSIANRPGAYLRIIETGEIAAGSLIERIDVPQHGLTVGDIARIYYEENERARELLRAPELPAAWAQWARARMIHS